MVAGDFNQWDIAGALVDFPDLVEAPVGNTRGDRSLDRIFVNVSVSAAGCVPPLETDPDREQADALKRSDHEIAFARMELDRVEAFKMMKYTYRYYNSESERKFGAWLAGKDWSDLAGTVGSNEKAEIYQ